MAARKKAKRKPSARRKARAAPRRAESPGDLVVRIAEQMASAVERGLAKTLKKLPLRAATAAAKEKLKDAIGALRRQAESFRQQAQELEARGAEGAANVWRPLADRHDKTAAELARRLGK
jgi:hypothetical protein